MVAEIEPGQFLQVVVCDPRVIDDDLQYQGLAPRQRRPGAAQHGARRKLRAHHHIGAAAEAGTGTARAPAIEAAPRAPAPR